MVFDAFLLQPRFSYLGVNFFSSGEETYEMSLTMPLVDLADRIPVRFCLRHMLRAFFILNVLAYGSVYVDYHNFIGHQISLVSITGIRSASSS